MKAERCRCIFDEINTDLLRHILFSRILVISLASALLYGCAEEKATDYVKKPPNLLSKEKMISFLIDLHLAEAKMSYIGTKNADSTEMLFRHYEKYLFEKHQIDDSSYYQSYQYYLVHMDQLDEIYSAVVDSLNVMSSMEKAGSLNNTNR